MRIITYSDWTASSGPLFKQLGILNIYQQHKLQLAIFVHDVLHRNTPKVFEDFFIPIHHAYATRQNVRNDLDTPKARTQDRTIYCEVCRLKTMEQYTIGYKKHSMQV